MTKIAIVSPLYNGLYKYIQPLYKELNNSYKTNVEYKLFGNYDMTFDLNKIKKNVNIISKEIIDYNPDIIHYNYGTYDIEQLIPYFLYKKGFKSKNILTYHSLQLDLFKKVNSKYYDKVANYYVGKMDGYIFFTNYARKIFEERYQKANLYKIAFHPATHLEECLSEEQTLLFDKKFNINRNNKFATLLGYPSHWKDTKPIISLAKNYDDITFVIAGPWWKEKIIKENPSINIDELKNILIINKELNNEEFIYALDLGVGLFPYNYYKSFQGSGLLPNYLFRGINVLVNKMEPMDEYFSNTINFYDNDNLFKEFEKVINNKFIEKKSIFSYYEHTRIINELYMEVINENIVRS